MSASERLAGALLDRITHHVHILEMNADSYRLKAEPIAATAPVRITRLPPWVHRPLPRAAPPPAAHRARRPARGALPWTTRTSYRRSSWYIFAPPRRYIITPPLTADASHR